MRAELIAASDEKLIIIGNMMNEKLSEPNRYTVVKAVEISNYPVDIIAMNAMVLINGAAHVAMILKKVIVRLSLKI